MEFIDLVVGGILKNQFHTIDMINEYINVLQKHDLNFETTKPLVKQFVEKMALVTSFLYNLDKFKYEIV